MINKELPQKEAGKTTIVILPALVVCSEPTSNHLEDDLTKIATINFASADNENQQEPPQKADYEFLKSHKRVAKKIAATIKDKISAQIRIS